MKQHKFILTLLMAIAMMAISPQSAWAQIDLPDGDDEDNECYHYEFIHVYDGNNKHQDYCSSCGEKSGRPEDCEFSNGVCVWCGHKLLVKIPFDVALTKAGASSATISKKNAALITINKSEAGNPQVAVQSGSEEATPTVFEHASRYDFALTPVTTITTGDEDIKGNIEADAKPRRTAAALQEPTLTGPALVVGTATAYTTYPLDAEHTSITLAMSADGKYVVNDSEIEGTVTSIYFYDSHQLNKTNKKDATCTDLGWNAYCYCKVCSKRFSDETCTKELQSSDIYINPLGHDYSLLSATPDSKGLYSYVCSHDNTHIDSNYKIIKDYAPNAEGDDKNLVLMDDVEFGYITNNDVALTDANQFKDVDVEFLTAVSPTYTRTMSQQWGTIVLPFEVNPTSVSGFAFYEIKSISAEGVIRLKAITKNIGAGKSVFVRRTGESTELKLKCTNTTVKTSVSSTAAGDYSFFMDGVYSKVVLNNSSANSYFIYNDLFWNANQLSSGSTMSILPFHAYLSAPAASGAKQLVIVEDGDETTSINNEQPLARGAQATQLIINNEAGAVYNLNGQKLAAPHKGINIINGRKVLVK